MADTMRAWQLGHPGPVTKTLTLNPSHPKPSAESLKPGQILVRIARAALNPADYKIPSLGLASRAISSYPKIPGMDLCGHVIATAPDVTDAKPGNLVMGRLPIYHKSGSLAECTVLNGDSYVTMPEDFPLDQAAGAPTVGMTAFQSIEPYVQPGDEIFLNGGSGGVGLFGIQIAKALGCVVTATCSTSKAELCRKYGADHIIDYKTTDPIAELKKRGQVFKLAVDNVGSSPPGLYANVHHFVLPGGKYIFVGAQVTMANFASMSRSIMLPGFLGGGKRSIVFVNVANDKKLLGRVAELLTERKVETVVDKVFEFDEVPKAFEHLMGGSCGGKVIVRVEE